MYRIHFDPALGKFVVQVLSWGIFWVTVRNGSDFATFATFENAERYITDIGLNKLYENKSADKFRRHMAQA